MSKITYNNIIQSAINQWTPRHIVVLFSGGYDSMVLGHLLTKMELDIPISTWAINTQLSADGWTDFVSGVAEELRFPDFHIYENRTGFLEYVEWVSEFGCPRGKSAHNRAYTRLKERAIDSIHMMYKEKRSDKTLFLSGIRQAESQDRQKLTQPIQRAGTSNKIFANPLFYWTNEETVQYRIEQDLPDNPFYSTVKGSGDCQCNWGNFITLGTLKNYSPKLAAGNVALLDESSRERHGYGWDGTPAMDPLFEIDEYLETPNLCSNCSRNKGDIMQALEWRVNQ